MITSRGIFNDLNESYYSYTAYGLIFYFSSIFYREKFKKEVIDYVNREGKKLKAFYKVKSNFDSFLAVSLYKRIEKRGFRVINDVGLRKEFKEDDICFVANLIS